MPTTVQKLEWKKWNYVTIWFSCYKIHLRVTVIKDYNIIPKTFNFKKVIDNKYTKKIK